MIAAPKDSLFDGHICGVQQGLDKSTGATVR
jgi:hypothetical protein